MRIPGPPPVPGARPSVRERSDTNPGVGPAAEAAAAAAAAKAAQAPRRIEQSLLTTQVGLGAVRLDPSGAPIGVPLSKDRRFLVRAGDKPGELVLTVLPEGVTPPSTVMSVRLVIDKDQESVAIARLIDRV